MSELVARLTAGIRPDDEERFMLQRVQPALIGLIDGTVSTLAPIFATAFLAGSHAALFVGLAAALGAGISMGMSEALSDDGEITGRGTSLSRGLITGGATFFGGSFHALPFVISDLHTALVVASFTVGCELIAIAWIRKRFLNVSLRSSLVQVTLGGLIVAVTGALIGQA
jgi:VIT1/CCC1 family predicted Fe2+/Mn2+ transporter